ncbi:uncharacterized protein LOC123296768 [Chrysoperla carnea]|uniref:uncharacterized protein LOC123296768 n=1 Tax=Chrysoperla carnea TaxID=189513 RepID=UPI001D076EF0|nr:uncharacterized protein LOC123296768 [Chrysoperla carnea]
MKQSHFAFIIACCILYTFRSDMLNPAAEILKLGEGCPTNISGLSNFTLDELSGLYSAAAALSNSDGSRDYCYKMCFQQVNNDRTDVRVAAKKGYFRVPWSVDLRFQRTSDNGTFEMRTSLTGFLTLGEAYILSNSSTVLYYSCRNDLLGSYREALVLSKNETTNLSAEDLQAAKDVLKAQNLDFGLMKTVDQSRETCSGLTRFYNMCSQ